MVLSQKYGHLILEDANYFKKLLERIVAVDSTKVLDYYENRQKNVRQSELEQDLFRLNAYIIDIFMLLLISLWYETSDKISYMEQKVTL